MHNNKHIHTSHTHPCLAKQTPIGGIIKHQTLAQQGTPNTWKV